MKISKKLISLFLALAMLVGIAPWSSIKASASFTGALQFNANGKFTIMQVNDIQDDQSVDSTVISAITKNIARYHPDLVVFDGDNIIETISSVANFQASVNQFLAPLLATNTKFAITFGNHDADGSGGSLSSQYAYYKSHGGSLFIDQDVPALDGDASGVIPVYPNGQTSGTPAYQVYVMDSGHNPSSGSYDCCYTSQIDYYIQQSLTYPNVPSIWFQHVPVIDLYTRCMTTTSNGTTGYTGKGTPFSSHTYYIDTARINYARSYSTNIADMYKEASCPADQAVYESAAHRSSAAYGSKTLYEAWRDYGNFKGAYFGHDHLNKFTCTTSDGIDLGYGKGTTMYKTLGIISYNDGNPGCSIYQLDISGSYTNEYSTNVELANDAMVTYDANGGLGTVRDQWIAKNSSATLHSNAFSKAGYIFSGWNTKADGTGTSYADGASITVSGIADVTLYAKWTSSTFSNITFNANGGSGGTGPTAMQAGTALTAPTVTRTGYTFAGWSPSVPATVPAVDTTYTAQWTANTYTVSYNANGGTGSTSSSSHTYGISANLTTNGFTKTGYNFLGWSTDSAAATPAYTNGQSVLNLTASQGAVITLYAVWSVNQYTINFDANGGTGSSSGLMTYGAALAAPTVTRAGYTFSGWSPAVPSTVPAANTTYTAQWNLIQVSITFDANGGGGGTGPTAMTPGAALTAPAVTKTGYTLIGWSPSLPATVPSVNQTYIAQWAINSYTLTFDANGGTGGTSYSMAYGAQITNIPAVARTGYTFIGWSPIPETVPAADTTFTAQWSVNSYTITFDANGGVGGTSASLHYGLPMPVPTVTKEGYIFAGWTPDVPATVPAANQTYTAQWNISKYTITFDANGGTGSTSGLFSFGDPITAPAVAREGYTFTGWTPAVPATAPSVDMTYTSQWTINSYRITFEAAGGTGSSSSIMVYGSPLSAPAVSRVGYVLTGWSPAVPGTVPAADTTYTAIWSAANYIITFDANGGTGGTSAPMAYGSVISAPIVTRFGYTLAGWSPSLPATVPAANTTYKAKWVANNYVITFDANGGTGGTSAPMAYETALAAPAVTRAGYSLTGWLPSLPSTVPAANTTYVAQWSPNSYTITFDANGGTGGTSASMVCGTQLSLPTVTRNGYTFAGWLPSVPDTVPTTDTTYIAQWNPNNYTITFDASGGTGGTIGSQPCGSALIAPVITRDGYTFTGWSPSLPATVPAADTTYTALWSINSYTVTFYAAGGTGGTTDSLTYGSSLTSPAVTKNGYTFAGWSPSVPATVPSHDATYTALWNVNSYTITFNANGGVGGTSITLAFGSAISAPAVTKSGYDFSGWSPEIPTTMPAQSLQVNAIWTPAVYYATFMVDGMEYASVPIAFGSAIVPPADPVKPGNLFIGWDPGFPSTMPANNLTSTAMWFTLSYTVSFDLNGGTGTVPGSQTAVYNSAVSLPAQGNITKQGYAFLGWAATADAAIPLANYTVPAGNATLYAVWGQNVNLIADSGSTTVINTGDNFIYGLKPGLTKADFESNFISINGNGRLAYTPDNGVLGTGTKVELIDNSTGAVLQTYTIVIFGDVNGDGNIDSIDAGVMVDVQNYSTTWDPVTNAYYYKAGDLNGDGNIDSIDAGLTVDFQNYMVNINQATGSVV
jgi:uncharacterized repeat protein (TIGR02543 family)